MPIILTPGPVAIPPEIKKILSNQPMHHRSDEFKKFFIKTLNNLSTFFGTKNPVIPQTLTGSGAMESALVNTLSPGDKVLVINSGKFGNRWFEIAKNLKLNCSELKLPWGDSFKVDQVLKNLDGKKAILTQLSETSTGALHPVKELASITKNKEVLLIVDTISALGAMEFEMDSWGVDVAFASSHKSFMSPPGVSTICLSDKAWEANKNSTFNKYYFDLSHELQSNKIGLTRFTPPVAIIQSIGWMLDNIKKHEQINRVKKISQAISLIYELGFKAFANNPSPSLTVALTPDGMSSNKVRDFLYKKYSIIVASGQGSIENKVIRIGHMGHIENQHIITLLKALCEISQSKNNIVTKAKKILE